MIIDIYFWLVVIFFIITSVYLAYENGELVALLVMTFGNVFYLLILIPLHIIRKLAYKKIIKDFDVDGDSFPRKYFTAYGVTGMEMNAVAWVKVLTRKHDLELMNSRVEYAVQKDEFRD